MVSLPFDNLITAPLDLLVLSLDQKGLLADQNLMLWPLLLAVSWGFSDIRTRGVDRLSSYKLSTQVCPLTPQKRAFR